MKLAEAFVEIIARREGLTRGLGQARTDITQFQGYASRALGAIGAISGGYLTFRGIQTAVGKAADLNEQLSKTKEVFKGSTNVVTATVDRLADRFGVVKTQAYEAASNIGLIARGAGLTEAAAANMAAGFTELATDASSFFNVGIDVALEKIRSGLVGESEPLRAFGVLLSESAVQAEAASLGIAKMGQKLTEAQKVEARASLIRKGLATATGDLERTQDSYSNKQRKMQGQLENFTADVGEKLIGPMSELLNLTGELAGAFQEAFGTGPVDAFAQSMLTAIDAFRIVTEINKNLGLKNPTASAGGAIDFLSGKSLTKVVLGVLNQPLLDQAAEGLVGKKSLVADAAAKAKAAPAKAPEVPAPAGIGWGASLLSGAAGILGEQVRGRVEETFNQGRGLLSAAEMTLTQAPAQAERFGSAQTFGDALSYVQSTQQSILDQENTDQEIVDGIQNLIEVSRTIAENTAESKLGAKLLTAGGIGSLVQSGPQE